ncbi:MAG: sulfite exporter TauE/SafE family protein [Desulfohalobiaceae bacterium]|nr:sulfite exporter TauE/SafE family protein [Desulfohalobiaceae bacterium]MCF8086146.1 sulfite exporter TauE/SafE family protein [Desulfohalobiaceae bacterium]
MINLAPSLQTALGSSMLFSAAICFGGGVLASLSPCVYPLLPVVATYVGSRSIGDRTRTRAFFMSLAYVLGLAVVYTALGMAAALTGSLFGGIASSPWARIVVANIFILLGLNVLEVIPLPFLSGGGGGRGRDRQGFFGAFTLGAASGIVASPCTAPVLGVVLTYVATTQDVIRGGVLLFAFSLGLGLLLMVVGTFAGVMTALPKPGNWMNLLKKILGLIMIAIGEYYLILAGQVMF